MANIKYVISRALQMDYKAMIKKINSIHKRTGMGRIAIFNDMRECATKYGAGYMDYDLFEMYNLTDKERDTYITRGRNNELIHKYNDKDYIHNFLNKTEFNTLFKDFIGREWIDFTNSKKEDVIEFMKKYKTFMFKPASGKCGHGIEKIITKKDTSFEELYEELKKREGNYELEEMLIQDEKVSAIYPDAVNTVRIITILDDNKKPHVICAYFRIGNGKHVDNFNSGGMVAPVDELTGIVLDKAIDKKKNLYECHPKTNHIIKGFQFPNWEKALELVKKASLVVPEVRYIGWDVCFSKNGPVLVEGNEYPGHDIYQLPEHTPERIGIWPKFTKINENEKKAK